MTIGNLFYLASMLLETISHTYPKLTTLYGKYVIFITDSYKVDFIPTTLVLT